MNESEKRKEPHQWNMADTITSLRMVFSVSLLFFPIRSIRFLVVYSSAGLTDVLDGRWARKTGTASEFGARLDSISDLLFYSILMLRIFPYLWQILPKTIWCLVIAIVQIENLSFHGETMGTGKMKNGVYMKKIGLIGGTGPESTLVYYRELNKRLNEKSSDTEFPEIAVESLNLHKALGLVGQEKYEELTDYIAKRVRNLEQGGAEIIALTAATMHIVYDELSGKVDSELVSIPETAASYALTNGFHRVGLLGTVFTMEKNYLSKAFVDKGIEVIVPDANTRELVNDRIANQLEYGIVKESTVEELVKVISDMQEHYGIEAIILGCTELPLALNDQNSPVPCIDIMEQHIRRLVELAWE